MSHINRNINSIHNYNLTPSLTKYIECLTIHDMVRKHVQYWNVSKAAQTHSRNVPISSCLWHANNSRRV